MAQVSTNLLANKFAYVSKESPSSVISWTSNAVTVKRTQDGASYSQAYVGFNAFPSSLKNKRLYGVTALFSFSAVSSTTGAFLCPSAADFNPSTLVWTNRPGQLGTSELIATNVGSTHANKTLSYYGDSATADELSALAAAFLKYNAGFFYCSKAASGTTVGESNACRVYKVLADRTSTPYLTVSYDDSVNVQSVITPSGNCPTSGYVNPRADRTFTWTFEKNDIYSCAGAFEQSSASLYWKTSASSTWNQINASGATQSLTVPANTFTAGETIQWYLQGTDTAGTSSTSETYTFSTQAAPVVITPLEPVNSVIDGSRNITFSWSYSTTDGYAPNAYSLEWRVAGEIVWQELYEDEQWATSCVVSANTMSAGEIQWRIAGQNIDGTYGEWYSAAFVNVAAPEINGIQATEVPYSTITWQIEGQQAFQIEAGGKTYGPYFGADKIFTLPEYLPDGTHTIRIKALGEYGMWSAWYEISVNIENVPGDPVTLNGKANFDVGLSWETEDTVADFFIVRDGKIIGHTAETFYSDRFTTGNHVYKVINRLQNGNYTESNQISKKVCLKNNVIAPLAGGEWLEIKFAIKDQANPVYEESVEVTYDHFGGFEFPSATISEYRDINASYSAAFPYFEEDKHRRFKALFGKPVVVKTKDGEVQIGILNSWSRSPDKHYYTGYTFTIRRIDWEDYVDDTH